MIFVGVVLTVSSTAKQFGIQFPVSYHEPSGQPGGIRTPCGGPHLFLGIGVRKSLATAERWRTYREVWDGLGKTEVNERLKGSRK